MKISNLSRSLDHHAFIALGALGAFLLVGCGGKMGPDPSGSQTGALSEDGEGIPPLPSPTLAVPAGNRLAFHLDAVGVQIYSCNAAGSGYAWTFVAPSANLYHRGGDVVAIHYKGPTWQWLEDGSTVVGAKLAAFTPDPTAIPWLLLGAASHTGDGRMSKVSYVQRLETTAGLAPATGCDASAVGTTANSPYTATYFFYKPSEGDASEPGHGHEGSDDSP
jgi:hypothetical protein